MLRFGIWRKEWIPFLYVFFFFFASVSLYLHSELSVLPYLGYLLWVIITVEVSEIVGQTSSSHGFICWGVSG